MHSLTDAPVTTLASYHPLPSCFAFTIIAPPRIHPLAPYRSPVITRSRSVMAQFVGDSQVPVAREMVPVSVPPAPALTPSVRVSPSLVQLPPLYFVGQWQAPPDLVAETVLVTVARAPETPLTPPPQGNVTFDTHPAAANFALGPLPHGQSVS